MNGLLSLLLAGATLTGAADDQAPKPKIDISAQVYMPDGKASGASRRIEVGSEPVVLYVYTGKTLCEARTVSTEKPVVAGNGWKVTATLSKGVEIVGLPGPAPKLKVTWQRLWEGGRELANGPVKTSTTTFAPGNSIPLDTIDGGSRRAVRDVIARMSKYVNGDPIPEEIKNDGEVKSLMMKMGLWDHEIRMMKSEQHLADGHPKVVEAQRTIIELQAQLMTRIHQLAEAANTNPSIVPTSTTTIDGCAALSMNLQVEAIATNSQAPVFEMEWWLIHRDPSGKETTQRQVVRTGALSSEFFFDDIVIDTERGRVTVEVFGEASPPRANPADNSVFFNMSVNRRYVTTNPAFAWKTKEGNNAYGGSRGIGEVVAYQLPPLPDDGALVGHRFSLRVRVKVLQ